MILTRALMMLTTYRSRWGWGALIALLGMAYAFYAEHSLELAPCNLCMLQRFALVSLGLVYLAAFLHNPSTWGRWIYGLLSVAASMIGIGVAGRHVWLQQLPEHQVPACGLDFDYLMASYPLLESILYILEGSGDCAEVKWAFIGLSMPSWVLLMFLGYAVLSGMQVYTGLTGKKHKYAL